MPRHIHGAIHCFFPRNFSTTCSSLRTSADWLLPPSNALSLADVTINSIGFPTIIQPQYVFSVHWCVNAATGYNIIKKRLISKLENKPNCNLNNTYLYDFLKDTRHWLPKHGGQTDQKTRSRRDYGPADFGSLQTQASVKFWTLATFLICVKKLIWPFRRYLRDSEAVNS